MSLATSILWPMPQSVAVPEKTIEHWSSQYIMFRYGTKVALWWPATGQDIDFGSLPNRPGKAVQLELKTITTAGFHRYEVHVDLGQLWEYRQRPLGHQPFYAFPWPQPSWNGSLSTVAAAVGKPATELAFSKRGQGLWFANWMVALTTTDVARVLRNDLNAHGSRTRGKVVPLVRFDHGHATWANGTTNPGTVPWLDFWDSLEQCGRIGWPQLIRLPSRLPGDHDLYDRPEIIRLLRRTTSRIDPDEVSTDQLITLEPNAEGAYRVTDSALGRPTGSDQDSSGRSGEPDDRRLVAFLSAHAIQAVSDPRGHSSPSDPETDPFDHWPQ